MLTKAIHTEHGCWILSKNINRKSKEMIGDWELNFDNDLFIKAI